MRTFFISLLATFILFSCNSNADENSENKDSAKVEKNEDSLTIEESKLLDSVVVYSDSLFKTKLPIIDSLITNENLKDSLINYFNKIYKAEITNEATIKSIFKERKMLWRRIEPYAYKLEEKMHEAPNYWDKFANELKVIGFKPVYAEGMLASITTSKILEKEIAQYGSPDYQLYFAFLEAESNSLGGEYPYLDLTYQIEMVVLGEKMAKKHPKSPYNDSIFEAYQYALSTLTDFHKVKDASADRYLLNGISRDFWPNATDISFMEKFVKEHSRSRFAPSVKKILANTSELSIGEDPNKGEVYLISVTDFGTEKAAKQQVFEYLNSGKDIPHVIHSKTGEAKTYHAVYRFYSDKTKAEENLKIIKSKFKDAKLILIDFNWQVIGE